MNATSEAANKGNDYEIHVEENNKTERQSINVSDGDKQQHEMDLHKKLAESDPASRGSVTD